MGYPDEYRPNLICDDTRGTKEAKKPNAIMTRKSKRSFDNTVLPLPFFAQAIMEYISESYSVQNIYTATQITQRLRKRSKPPLCIAVYQPFPSIM